MIGERARERLAGEDVAAHAGEELPFAVALGLLDRGVQRLLDGEAGGEQRRELAGEERERRGAEPPAAEREAVPRTRRFRRDRLDLHRQPALLAQASPRLARAVGLEHPALALAVGA